MSGRRFERADQWSPKAPPSRKMGATTAAAPTFADALKPYKTYIILGVAALGVLIAYQLYMRRASQKKDPAQIEAGTRAIEAAAAQERPKLQVDPQVIEVLQNQVLSYQQQIAELEDALARTQQQQQQQQQEDPIAAQMRAASSMGGAGSGAPQFAGLHGQLGPDATLGRGAPSMGGYGGPEASTAGRDGGGGMAAFAGDPMPAMSGFGGAMGGSDYNSPFQDGVTSQAMAMGAGGGGRNPAQAMQMPPR